MKKVTEKKARSLRKALRNGIACLAAFSLVLGTVQVSADSDNTDTSGAEQSVPTGEPTQDTSGEDTQTPATPTPTPISYDYIVTDYGADGTDKKSDQAAIQNALDQVKGATRQMTVYFPAGDYYIDQKALQVYSNTHIILDQKATVYRMDSMIDKMLIHNVDQNGKMDVIGGYDMSHDITLEGGTWDGGNVAKAGANDAADVIRFDHAKNIVMKDCNVKNVYDCHLIEYVAVNGGSITGCTLSGFRYHKGKENDSYYAREAIQLETAWTNKPNNKNDVNAMWAQGSIVDGSSCKQITVSNNTFIDMPCGVGQHHYTNDGKYRNQGITISNNTLSCSSNMKACKTAITCSGMNDITITGNKVTGPYRFGIYIAEAGNVTFSDNSISSVLENGIMMNSGTVKAITGNTISDTAGHSISIAAGTLTTLSGNTINNPKLNGISIVKGKIGVISNNKLNNVKKNGISVTGNATINQMTGNILNKIGHDGIVQGKGKTKLIKNNKINTVKLHGISITGGTIGVGKKRSKGIIANEITNCTGNAISISKKAVISAIHKNKITSVKKNGISIVNKSVVYWVTNNTIKKCKKHGIWNGSSRKKAKLKGNKGKTK